MTVETLVRGKVVRFESTRGYGFIAPLDGGDDVFVHANDLKSGNGTPVSCGTTVEFKVLGGERGLKAYDVRILDEPGSVGCGDAPVTPSGDDTCDVLSVTSYMAEVTELVISAAPTVTGTQIAELRVALCRMAMQHGWVE